MSTYDPYDDLKDDWKFTEGVLDAGFSYGPDRDTTGLPTEPSVDEVKVRLGNPTQNQIAVAASTMGYEATDRVLTIWANTLRSDPTDGGSDQIEPQQGDKMVADGLTWIIAWAKATVYKTQWLCYVRQSQTGA